MAKEDIDNSTLNYSEALSEISLPGPDDIGAIRDLSTSMDNTPPDGRYAEALSKGLVKDLAPCFDPASRKDAPGPGNSVSSCDIGDMGALVDAFDSVAAALGYKPPAPSQRRYTGPVLRLRHCMMGACDMSLRHFAGPLELTSCTFTAPANFTGATFKSRAGFQQCSFEAGADFGLSRFQADVTFSAATFAAGNGVCAAFAGMTCSGQANFDLVQFASAVQFDYVTFERETRFFRSAFAGDARFGETTFRSEARFDFASFAGPANFNDAWFAKAPDFHQASFGALVNFRGADFEEYLDLRSSRFADEAFIDVADMRVRASTVMSGNFRLTSAQLKGRRVFPIRWWSLIDSDSAGKIRSTAKRKLAAALDNADRTDRDKARAEYRRTIKAAPKGLLTACRQYGALEENFRAQGDPDSRSAEDFCHYRYHNLWRQTRRKLINPLRWADWFFLKICFGYGVYPLRYWRWVWPL